MSQRRSRSSPAPGSLCCCRVALRRSVRRRRAARPPTGADDDAAARGGRRHEGGRRARLTGTDRLVELAHRQPRPVRDEHRRLRRQADHPAASAVDWFPRFSPDGSQHPVHPQQEGLGHRARRQHRATSGTSTRSTPDGTDATKVVDSASWGSWISNDEIVYVRAHEDLPHASSDGDEETCSSTAAKASRSSTARCCSSPRCRRTASYLAITLRGSKRETGHLGHREEDLDADRARLPDQLDARSDERGLLGPPDRQRRQPQSCRCPIKDGKPAKERRRRRPALHRHARSPLARVLSAALGATASGWCGRATQRGHDHDIADYEIYLWQVGTPPDKAVRLTYHSGNDRWPDIFIRGRRAA